MKRRDLLRISTAVGLASLLPGAAGAGARSPASVGRARPGTALSPLPAPVDGDIPVAVLISDRAVVIDFAGPWTVFENVRLPGREAPPFRLYTVAETAAPIQASGGMIVTPNYALAAAPAPKVIVIPAQSEPSAAVIAWLRGAAAQADITMSVCTGAFVLAMTGLLAGKAVATHHGFYAELAAAFPDIQVRRGARFVDLGTIASAGGLSSGIDLALHVVARYFGQSVAVSTADALEYQGQGWLDPDSNRAYAKPRVSTAQHPLCAVCQMDVDLATAPKSAYRGRSYYFCSTDHKTLFDAHPDRFVV